MLISSFFIQYKRKARSNSSLFLIFLLMMAHSEIKVNLHFAVGKGEPRLIYDFLL